MQIALVAVIIILLVIVIVLQVWLRPKNDQAAALFASRIDRLQTGLKEEF